MIKNPEKANLIAKFLFIAGGIILFIILVIVVFKIVPKALSGLSNLGSDARGIFSSEKIKISIDSETVEVLKPVAVSFEYTPEQEGQYYISYTCVDGLFFDIQSKDGPKRIVCDTPLKLGSSLNSISLVPIFTESNIFVDSTISILFKDTKGNTLASGTKIITIAEDIDSNIAEETKNIYSNNDSLAGSNVTTKSLETVIPPFQGQTAVGNKPIAMKAVKDLTITYISSIDKKSAFILHVYNYGNTSTGPWEFSYTDAENPSRTSLSPIQAGLKSGQGLAITVGFDGQDNTRQTINVTLDPLNKVVESNETNNSKSVIISGNTNTYSDYSFNSNNDADLTITVLEVGRISGSRFVEDDEIDEDDTAAVRFVVKNEGGESTGSWRFKIDNLPYIKDDTYRSKSYSSLRPGQSTEIIADFEGINKGRYSLKVEVDSDDDVNEERENNNVKTENLKVNR